MDISDFVSAFDAVVNTGLRSLEENFGSVFDVVQIVFASVYEGVLWLLVLAPFYVVALVVAVLGWRVVNLGTGFCWRPVCCFARSWAFGRTR